MEYTTLGKTGINISRIGFGGATAGLTNYLGKFSPEDAVQRRDIIKAIHKAIELGINYFDTAAAYGAGASEGIFGEALRGHTEEIFLATKVATWANVDTRASVEASLKRLGVDCVDLIQLHGTSYTPEQAEEILRPGGTLDVLEDLRSEGLVRFIGFTTEDENPPVYQFIQTGRFDVVQTCYNLIFQHPAEPTRPFGTMYEAEKQCMGIVVMRTLTSGIFQKWVQWVNPANDFDYSPALIQFVLSNPLVDVALIGTRSPARVTQNVAICDDLDGRIDIDALHERYVDGDG
jgi:aryl-alcohol dehydrogenase-like predicted oxidoreductase